MRAYQATGELRLLADYLTGKTRCYGALGRLNRLAGADAAGLAIVQASLGERAFEADDQATVGAGTTVTVRVALAGAGVPPARTDRTGGGFPD